MVMQDMKIGLDRVAGDKRYGMPLEHMVALILAAQGTNTAIGVRPVSPYAKYFIEQGYPTKSFVIKNKSANLGIAAGLIPISPKYGRDPPKKYADHDTKIVKAKHADVELQEVPLTLSKKRLGDLIQFFPDNFATTPLMRPDPGNPAATPIVVGYEISWEKGEEKITVRAMANDSEGYDIEDEDGMPLYVLGKGGKPITADYDLLVTCPHYHELDPGKADKMPFNTQGRGPRDSELNIIKVMEAEAGTSSIGMKREVRAESFTLSKTRLDELLRGFPDRMVRAEPIEGGYDLSWTEAGETVHVLALANETETEYILADQERKPLSESSIMTPKEDPKMGNVSPRTMTLIDTINTKINRGIGLETVHHNAEFYNPFADDLENHIPALFVFPKAMDLSRVPGLSDGGAPGSLSHVDVVLIESVKEMFAIRNYMKEEGYSWSSHAKYVGHLPAFSPEAKVASEDAIKYAIERTRAFKEASHRLEGDATPDSSPDSVSFDEDEENDEDDSHSTFSA